MPTFFGRRYMRGAPGRTERTLGVALLVFVVAVAMAFGLTTGLFGERTARSGLVRSVKSVLDISDQPLFAVKRSSLPPSVSHGMRWLYAMLPTSVGELKLRNDYWSAPTLIPLDTKPKWPYQIALVDSANAFGAKQMAFAMYVGPSKGGYDVRLLDVGDPESAFGLWRSRTPPDAKSFNVGRTGWRSDERSVAAGRIGFWTGRYYTEIVGLLSLDRAEDARFAESLARAIAERQLVYGGPFWAESVLPTDGRVADSLRFVKHDPLGLKVAADCWLADYPGGITIGVMKASGQQREAVLAAAKAMSATTASKPATEASEQESAAEEKAAEASAEKKDDRLEVGPTRKAGDAAPAAVSALPAGEYVFLGAGPDATAVAAALKPLVEQWSKAKPVASTHEAVAGAAAPAAGGQGPFVDLGDPQILSPTRIEKYTDNLYEKIDGREPQFRQFGFAELRVGSYQFVPKQATYDAYIFDMGEPVNAMGIYMTEKSDSSHGLKLGRDGYVSGASVYFWKGKHYVYILGPADAGADAAAIAERIAGGIEKTLDDKREPFWAEKILPAEDRVPDSFSYRATSGLGFDFLQQMFVTAYKTGDKTYQMYIIRAENAQVAKTLFDKFAEATTKYDKIVGRSGSATDSGGETLVSESLGVFGVAFHKGVYFGGVAECDDRALAEKRAGALRDSLPEK